MGQEKTVPVSRWAVAPANQAAEDADTDRIVARIQSGDRDAFALLYMRYFERIYAYLRLILADHHAAEDAAQEVFLRASAALPRYQPRPGQPFRSWLFVIARNYSRNALAKRSASELVDSATVERALEASGAQQTDFFALTWLTDAELTMLVGRLPLPQRQVLMLRYMMDLSYEQIGEILGRSAIDVRSLHSRAVRFLRARLAALSSDCPSAANTPLRRRDLQAPVLRSRRFALDP